tara:strand:+ start:128 stop:400 length:273 start_codon:yes stop_codon:yes gene_type:complete
MSATPTEETRFWNLRSIAADDSVNNFARSVCAEAASYVEKIETELAATHRALALELQQHRRSHEEVLRLAERLRKYQPGSPMILNSGEKK